MPHEAEYVYFFSKGRILETCSTSTLKLASSDTRNIDPFEHQTTHGTVHFKTEETAKFIARQIQFPGLECAPTSAFPSLQHERTPSVDRKRARYTGPPPVSARA